MSQGFRRNEDPVESLRRQLIEMQNQIKDLQRVQPFRIPLLTADPADTDPTNMWLLPDGRLRARHRNPTDTAWVYREWASTTPGSGASGTAAAPPASAPVTRQVSWPAIWTQGYRQSGPQRTDYPTYMHYGSVGDSFNGRNRSLIGFDYAAIASALSGSTILQVWLTLFNIHSYWNNGSDIFFGIHNFTSKPSTWAGGGIPSSMIYQQHFGKPQQRTVNMPLAFAQAIRDGWGKGIALEAPSNSLTQYGFAAGVGSGYVVPTLIVQYAK